MITLSRIVLLSSMLVSSLFVKAQNKTTLLKIIRDDFQAINHDKTLTKTTLSNEQFLENMTDGGGELAGYYKKDSLVKIVEWIGLSYGNRTREFYFKENKLFFVYEKFESFVHNDKTNELDLTKVKTTFEGRYYFNNKKLIDQKNSGKRTFEENESGMEEELQSAAGEDIHLLNKKKNNVN